MEEHQPTPIWKDPKQSSIIAVISLVGGLLSGAGLQVVNSESLFTQQDWQREEQSLRRYGDAKHAELQEKVTSIANDVVDREVSRLRFDIQSNRERLDKLLEQSARIAALVEQHMISVGTKQSGMGAQK